MVITKKILVTQDCIIFYPASFICLILSISFWVMWLPLGRLRSAAWQYKWADSALTLADFASAKAARLAVHIFQKWDPDAS